MARQECKDAAGCFLLHLNEMEREQPENNALPLAKAKTLRDTGANAESYQAAEEALARNPHHADGHTTLGQFLLLDSLTALAQGKGLSGAAAAAGKRRIIESFKTAHALNPLDVLAQDGLALLYNASGAQELTAEWAARRDATLQSIGVSRDCAARGNMLMTAAFAQVRFAGKWLEDVL